MIKTLSSLILFFSILSLQAQQHELTLKASESMATIQPTMYGIFFEDINFAADGGLYAEMVKNRSFEFEDPNMGWQQPQSDRFSLNKESGIANVVKTMENGPNRNYLHVMINKAAGYELINEGFRGMGVQKDARYLISFGADRGEGNIDKLIFQFIGDNDKVLGKTEVPVSDKGWKYYEATLQATATEMKAKLKITFSGNGTIDLDMISVFPEDTWKGRKKGLRKDLVQLLYDLNPGFLRFPGGCIVEGRTLARRYQWKKTVGPIEERDYLINRWNTEFSHRPTPDYFQSFGLGFFEYFQLSEDLGAEPLPILSCGMACQFNTGELVPMDELDPYIQDALDLIEFANGSFISGWGKVRADMGHPEPFNLKYIGVGNEQWGPEYIKRYKAFEAAIKAEYPDMVIVSGSGPFPDGEFFEYGMEELTKLNAEIVDEHYYRPPQWFQEHADRYDHYDRKGPKIFAGEYAAQSVAIASPDNKNNWECAMSEAAFMTGLERNADVVVMTSYAPLMAHAEGWQWTPDLIWFNNLEAYGTANYYVQKLFATNSGTDLLSITGKANKPLIGQDGLYASAVKDAESGDLIIKLVNVKADATTVSIEVKGEKIEKEGTALVLTSDKMDAVNSFETPMQVSPKEMAVSIKKNAVTAELKPHSLTVLKLKIK
ncbi:MAG: alpha-L-arabinofuranosidase C-terminal domain-containing protein [Saprospiraceae bacterium]|nr:alpha-L-arabinofuranosidase [Lewinella sp.]